MGPSFSSTAFLPAAKPSGHGTMRNYEICWGGGGLKGLIRGIPPQSDFVMKRNNPFFFHP